MNRRQFLLTTSGGAAGYILPSFFDKAFDFVEQFGEPLIVKPQHVTKDIFVCDRDGFLEFNLGNPNEEPTEMTYREYLERYFHGGVKAFIDEFTESELEHDLDEILGYLDVVDAWCRIDSPNAKAYRLLDGLDLGPNFNSPGAVGEIQFIDGACPGSDYLGVQTEELVSVSLLQERLSQLDTGIHVRVWEGS
ncbi:hypothetical protein N9H39_10310 [Gammaproteobacteria bacterium]|nr:hypothetical protein [Gammaproteobacteria bacterium]